MADPLEFEAFGAAHPECRQCEELLADAVDEVLSPADQARFDGHVATCADCMAAFADARRGAAWLEMLKTPRPEPSAQLLERIFAATSGAPQHAVPVLTMPVLPMPVLPMTNLPAFEPAAPTDTPGVLPFRPRLPRVPQIPRFAPRLGGLHRLLFEPRLALTAAMAFFSIALTLNLAGVRLNQLHADDLGPSGIRRSYYQATASVARRYEGLRVVHTLESQMNELRQADAYGEEGEGESGGAAPASHRDRPTAPPAPEPKKQAAPGQNQGKSQNGVQGGFQNGGVSRRSTPPVQPRLLPVADRKLLSAPPITPITTKEGGLA